MKKLLFTFFLYSFFSFSQDIVNKNGFPILPQSGDWSIGTDAGSIINFIGNISNVVLEAIANETAIITFKVDLLQSKDIESNEFLGKNVMYIDRYNIFEDLYNLIVEQIKDKTILEKYKTLSKINLKSKLLCWEKRLNIELDILKLISKK